MKNIKGIMVDIEGELFPAVNIQIWAQSPEIVADPCVNPDDHTTHTHYYGIYFELMFESGANLAVSQEMASSLNGHCSTTCSELSAEEFQTHFDVELTNARDRYREVEFAWHCVGEEELAKVLRDEMRRQARAA